MARRNLQPHVNCLLGKHHACVAGGVLYVWDGSRHVQDERAIGRLLSRMDHSLTRADRAEIIATVENLAPEVNLAAPRHIRLMDCVLDLATGETFEPTPDLVIPNVIPHAWDPAARDVGVEAFLDSISSGCPATLALIEEMLGAALYRGRAPYIWVIVGVAPVRGGDAANGKSTLCSVAELLVGVENAIELDVHDLGRNFMTASLRGALLEVSSDTSSDPVPAAALSILKKVPTQDMITADVKYSAPVRFKPYATVVIAANRVPGFIVDAGLKRRVRVIPLRGHFEERAVDYASELADEGCMSALLVHAVNGLRRLLEHGPTRSGDGDAALGSIAALSNTVSQWADDRSLSASGLDGRACAAAYRDYADWCGDSGTAALPKAEFEREVRATIPGLEVRKCRCNGSSPTRRWKSVESSDK